MTLEEMEIKRQEIERRLFSLMGRELRKWHFEKPLGISDINSRITATDFTSEYQSKKFNAE